MLDDCLPYLCVLLVSFYIKKTQTPQPKLFETY